MSDKATRDRAEPIAQDIMDSICYYLRHNLSFWPKDADVKDMKRTVKSIIVQSMMKEDE